MFYLQTWRCQKRWQLYTVKQNTEEQAICTSITQKNNTSGEMFKWILNRYKLLPDYIGRKSTNVNFSENLSQLYLVIDDAFLDLKFLFNFYKEMSSQFSQ